jgi:hypothetical protein
VIGAVLLLLLGGFCAGGALALFRQRKPILAVALLILIAFACVFAGANLAKSAAG